MKKKAVRDSVIRSLAREPGNYTISAYAQPVPGENNTANNNCTGGWVTMSIVGDVNGDFKVNMKDIALVARAFGSHCANYDYQGEPVSSNWNPNADIKRALLLPGLVPMNG